MVTDRRINTARHTEFLLLFRADHIFIQWLAHTMQTLEFVLASVVTRWIGQMINRGQRLGIVSRKLWINLFRCRQ